MPPTKVMCDEKRAIRNARARAKYAALSFEEKEAVRKVHNEYCRIKNKTHNNIH